MLPLDFLRSAEALLASNKNRPSRVNLRRATSATYYALFHTLARSAANLFIGGARAQKSRGAWQQLYRAIDHRAAKEACSFKNRKSRPILALFPAPIQDFANAFVTMQEKRHRADYDPYATFTKSAVQKDIAAARQVIVDFNAQTAKDRRAFCVHVLFRPRP